MCGNKVDNITPESVLEEMKNSGEINEEEYKELKFQFEDIEDAHKLNYYQMYDKAYKNDRMHRCIEILLEIAKKEPNTLKKGMLLSNCLKNPMGMKFNEHEYKKTMCILVQFLKVAEEQDCSSVARSAAREMFLYTYAFYHNNQTNTKKLLDSKFSQYSLSMQLRMICIYIQDQSRMMKQELFGKKNKRSFVTGMENTVANMKVHNAPMQKVSLADNYEGMLEYFNTLIRYLYISKKKDLKLNDVMTHGDIHPFNLPEFWEITYIAQQRRMYEMLEEKFRYSEWNIDIGKNEIGQDIYFLEPKNKDRYKSHLAGSLRREHQFKTEITRYSDFDKIDLAMKAMYTLAESLDLDNIENFHMNKENYIQASEIVSTSVAVYRALTKEYYWECKFQDLILEDIMKMYIFLFTYSQVYFAAVEKMFNEDDYSCYKYLVPVIHIEYLVNEFSNLHEIDKEKSRKLLDCFIFNEKIKGSSEDIFAKPLLKVNQNEILFCESLIEQMNIERCIEKILQRYDVDLAPVGKQFEKKLIDRLKKVNGIEVNTNTIQFQAFDGKDVEFDCLGILEDCLFLFEFKSVLIPYDASELHKREKVIKEGVEQVNRRCEVIKHDWDKIKELSNIDLPDEPYSEEKIIKVVCTNIYDFTTLKIDGVHITDESTLLKYFTNPFVEFYSKGKDATQLIDADFIWAEGRPTVGEFLKYLDKPVTVGKIPECFEDEFKIIPAFEGDYFIGFKDVILAKDPYREAINERRQIIKAKKIYPNDPCICGSGKKYKKCCGK